jgi:hypothetical protein
VTLFATAAGALEDEAPASPRPEAGDIGESKTNFFVRFTGFTRANSTAHGLLTPVFAIGTIMFNDRLFLFAGTFVCFPVAQP